MQIPQFDTHTSYRQLLLWISAWLSIPHLIRWAAAREHQWVFKDPTAIALPAAGSRLTLPNASPTMESEAVLDGELAVPCTRNPLQRGGIPLERPVPTGRCPRLAVLMVWSHAAQPRELRQVREEATVSEQLRVPWECLA